MKFPADLVKFTEEILNGKLHFLRSDTWVSHFNAFSVMAIHYLSVMNGCLDTIFIARIIIFSGFLCHEQCVY